MCTIFKSAAVAAIISAALFPAIPQWLGTRQGTNLYLQAYTDIIPLKMTLTAWFVADFVYNNARTTLMESV